MIDKFTEIIEKLKKEGKQIIIPPEQFARDMELMNESVEKTRLEFQRIQDETERQARDIIVRSACA